MLFRFLHVLNKLGHENRSYFKRKILKLELTPAVTVTVCTEHTRSRNGRHLKGKILRL